MRKKQNRPLRIGTTKPRQCPNLYDKLPPLEDRDWIDIKFVFKLRGGLSETAIKIANEYANRLGWQVFLVPNVTTIDEFVKRATTQADTHKPIHMVFEEIWIAPIDREISEEPIEANFGNKKLAPNELKKDMKKLMDFNELIMEELALKAERTFDWRYERNDLIMTENIGALRMEYFIYYRIGLERKNPALAKALFDKTIEELIGMVENEVKKDKMKYQKNGTVQYLPVIKRMLDEFNSRKRTGN